jgi:flagellar hook-basal body complex protein FliE
MSPIDGINNLASQIGGVGGTGPLTTTTKSGGAAGGASFADTLKNSIDEVSRLQQDASQAVENLATGKTENLNGVMTAVEKSDLAFKTLLSIRTKLMDAYEEIKNIPI